MADIIPIRPPLRRVESLTDAVAKALRAAEYQRAVEDGYSPKVVPIPVQKPPRWDRVFTVGGHTPKGAA